MKKSTLIPWICWTLFSVGLASAFAHTLVISEDKTTFMPGPLSSGHHQLTMSCESCHTDSFGGPQVMQKACLSCHESVREKPYDSHPSSKFLDPRNADRLEKIDALQCSTCHLEHQPEITAKDGFTLPVDFCVRCHQDIGTDRPSHSELPFTTCKDSGCHNYHDNQALYTDFLIKHMDAPAHKQSGSLPQRALLESMEIDADYPHDVYPLAPLTSDDMDAPEQAGQRSDIIDEWSGSVHAASGANCSACHQPRVENASAQHWVADVGVDACRGCHETEIARFGQGKHGMRIAAGLTPMTPADARLSMNPESAHRQLTCTSCHDPHDLDLRAAAVEACLGCHDDEHSVRYKDSSHYKLWSTATADDHSASAGASCATCHMPRKELDVSEWFSRIVVDHNQSANLSPNSKMIRDSCLHCHGLAFSLNALSDPAQIQNNFSTTPELRSESIEMARSYDSSPRKKEKTDGK